MTTHTTTREFLQAVFGNDHGTAAIFAYGMPPTSRCRDLSGLDDKVDCYWSVAAFAPGHLECTKHRALEVRALVIDDVGAKVPAMAVEMALGGPTGIVRSSAGNFQWSYRLTTPVAKDDWHAFADAVQARIGCKLDTGYSDAVHLYRLPMGMHTKSGSAVSLIELNPGNEFDPAGINYAAAAGGTGARASKAPEGKFKHIKRLVALLGDHDSGYWPWMARMHQIWVLAEDKEEGKEAFREFSERWTGVAKDGPDNPDAKWDSIREDDITTHGQLLLDDARAANPDEFARIMRDEANAVFDDGAVPPPVPPKGAVKFLLGKNDAILSMVENAKRAVAGLGLKVRYDEFHHRAFIERTSGTPIRVDDKIVLMLRDEITAAYGKEFGIVHVGEAVMTLAYLNGFNPVVEMLAEAEASWDGVKRLDRLGPDYFHTEKSKLAEACFRKVMIAAVRRARSPGCKFDQILVLESPEGWDKSTAWRVLAGDENFSDADILSKDAKAVQEELADIWIHEIADLAGLSRADVDHVKSFASRQNDRARPAYGRFLLDQPRQSIEVGTTNAETYLASITGNRRFWTFRLDARVDVAALVRDRMMLWGEAARAEAGGETLVLDAALWGDAAAAQEDRRVVDPWEDELMNLPDMAIKDVGGGMEGVTNVAVHSHLGGGHRGGQLTGASGRKISEIMKRLGWERTYIMDAEGKKVRGYKRRTDRTVGPGVDVSSVLKNPF